MSKPILHWAYYLLLAFLRQVVFIRQDLSEQMEEMYKDHVSGQTRLRPGLE